ncbi:reverse transcriptase domain-containing protein [Tanacetum coccineum]
MNLIYGYQYGASTLLIRRIQLNRGQQDLMELKGDKSFPIIISSKLSVKEKKLLLQVLEKRKGAIAWKMSDIKGINSSWVLNDNNELIPSRTVTGWRDSSRFQLHLKIKKRQHSLVLLGLLLTDFMEVFRDDFSVFSNSFDCCLDNLDRMLVRCIVVDRVKIDVIAKLPYPTNVKGVRSFLGHAGFYRRFIKDFSIISKPMTKLLMKDTKFDFSDDCKKAFNILKERLTTTPIIISPDLNVPFELMCDASDFAVGAVLGQRID